MLMLSVVYFVFRVVEHSERPFAYAIDYLLHRLAGKLSLVLTALRHCYPTPDVIKIVNQNDDLSLSTSGSIKSRQRRTKSAGKRATAHMKC